MSLPLLRSDIEDNSSSPPFLKQEVPSFNVDFFKYRSTIEYVLSKDYTGFV